MYAHHDDMCEPAPVYSGGIINQRRKEHPIMAKFLDFVEIDNSKGERYHTFLEVTPETQPTLDLLGELLDRAYVFEDSLQLWDADPRVNEDTIGLLENYSTNTYADEFVKGELTPETVEKLSELRDLGDRENLGIELLEIFHERRGIKCLS